MASHDASAPVGSLAAAAAAAAEAAVPTQQQQHQRSTSVPLPERLTYRIPIRREEATASADPIDPADRPIDPQTPRPPLWWTRRTRTRAWIVLIYPLRRQRRRIHTRGFRITISRPPGSTWSYARYQQDAGPVPAALAASTRVRPRPSPIHAASEQSAESIDFHDLAHDEDGDQSMLNLDDERQVPRTDGAHVAVPQSADRRAAGGAASLQQDNS
ncbi:hypothetical protein DFJ73DRAFT_759847, partial [Zopfochytrium polystomum]